MTSANIAIEAPTRIEPALLEEPPEAIVNVIAELSSASAVLGARLHPATVANLSDVVRQVNFHYSNLIEGHNIRPRDIERALAGDLDREEDRRNLQIEAAAHVHVQEEIDRLAAEDRLPEPASRAFIRWLHAEFYRNAPEAMLIVKSGRNTFRMAPGKWRSAPEHDVTVGRHIPPSSSKVETFMAHFEWRYRFERMGSATRILAMAAAHHRLNYIHPFPDGNGRVSRLMSHAMALSAGIGARGLWSVSRGLARGLESRQEYKMRMDHADTPRQGDLDGRGNLSQRALVDFTLWFLTVCLDQMTFMTKLFDLDNLDSRLTRHVERSDGLRPEAARLLKEVLIRGQIERGEASRITGLPERTARRVLRDVVDEGLLASATPKGPVSLRFPVDALEGLFPHLYPET
ncbi:MAG: Fic family protein [Paracoccaceae bacterium]|nr:Fic family protein [Paracoccaceae bacterium]